MLDLAIATSASLPPAPPVLERLGLRPAAYAVATVHRAANTDDLQTFERIIAGLRRVGMPVIFPVHPRTMPLLRRVAKHSADQIVAIEPLPYYEMIALVRSARVVLTDSGGLQKESVALGVPCVTLRDETEWVETCEYGWNALAGTDPDKIVRLAGRPMPSTPPAFFGSDGRCAARIVDVFLAGEAATAQTSAAAVAPQR